MGLGDLRVNGQEFKQSENDSNGHKPWVIALLCIGIILYVVFMVGEFVFASTVSVCNMASGSSAQVRIYDITAASQVLNWTNSGVTERSVGLSKSCYYYTASLTSGHAYQIDWEDSPTPAQVASETIYELQSYVDAAISSRSTFTGGAVASVNGAVGSVTSPVIVGTNNDKTGYTASSVTDKTGYQLISAYDPAKSAASQASVNAIPTNPVLVTDTHLSNMDVPVSSRLASSSYVTPDFSLLPAIKAQTDKLQFDSNNNVASTATATIDPDILASDILDASMGGHNIVGSVGYRINAAASAGDPWSANPSLYPAGTFGYLLNSATLHVYTFPVMQGSVYVPVIVQNKPLEIVRKDSPQAPFTLNADYTGWTAIFGAKISTNVTNTTYAIGPITAIWTNAALGQGYVPFTTTNTDIAEGSYYGELLLTNGSGRLTAIKFPLKILPHVIN